MSTSNGDEFETIRKVAKLLDEHKPAIDKIEAMEKELAELRAGLPKELYAIKLDGSKKSKRMKPDDVDGKVLAALSTSEHRTNAQIREATGLDDGRVSQSLMRLKDKLKKVPANTKKPLSKINTAYLLVKAK